MRYVIKKGDKYFPSKELKKSAWINNEKIYKQANKNPVKFWGALAEEITWFKKWKIPYRENFPFFEWFVGGKLNISYNALDRHLKEKAQQTALIWVPEPITEGVVKWTYKQLYKEVNKFANVLKSQDIKKGDVVCIYLPLIPEVFVSMLACSRIGAIHSVVFSAFSAEALKTRIEDGKAKLLITADGYYRKGEKENLLTKAREAAKETMNKIIIRRLNSKIKFLANELDYDKLMENSNDNCKPVNVDSKHPLFILYTSGTTGKPKGIIHDTGGYAVQSLITTKWDFNLYDNDIMWCTADVGWITGHTYAVYGPLLNGSTTLIYEGSPDYPTPSRFWKIINENKVTAFYTAPTALRMFRLWGEKYIPTKFQSLKILGTVGEPIDKETWLWYFENIGKKKLPIIDTWWQTETGTTMINSLPGIGPFIPGTAGKSFPGTRHGIINEKGKIIKKGKGLLVQFPPFAPAMLHGLWHNKEKYIEKYFTLNNKPTKFYVTGDAAILEKDNIIKILGRSDDVIKVAGHRLSTAELEDAVHEHPEVGDVAVVSKPDQIRGEAIVIFIRLKYSQNKENSGYAVFRPEFSNGQFEKTRNTIAQIVHNESKLKEEITKLIVKKIGPIAKPKEIYFVEDLPKTRSGKIMRRILKNLLRDEPLGELSTLVNPDCIEEIKKRIIW